MTVIFVQQTSAQAIEQGLLQHSTTRDSCKGLANFCPKSSLVDVHSGIPLDFSVCENPQEAWEMEIFRRETAIRDREQYLHSVQEELEMFRSLHNQSVRSLATNSGANSAVLVQEHPFEGEVHTSANGIFNRNRRDSDISTSHKSPSSHASSLGESRRSDEIVGGPSGEELRAKVHSLMAGMDSMQTKIEEKSRTQASLQVCFSPCASSFLSV